VRDADDLRGHPDGGELLAARGLDGRGVVLRPVLDGGPDQGDQEDDDDDPADDLRGGRDRQRPALRVASPVLRATPR